jgi:hypothetical protein
VVIKVKLDICGIGLQEISKLLLQIFNNKSTTYLLHMSELEPVAKKVRLLKQLKFECCICQSTKSYLDEYYWVNKSYCPKCLSKIEKNALINYTDLGVLHREKENTKIDELIKTMNEKYDLLNSTWRLICTPSLPYLDDIKKYPHGDIERTDFIKRILDISKQKDSIIKLKSEKLQKEYRTYTYKEAIVVYNDYMKNYHDLCCDIRKYIDTKYPTFYEKINGTPNLNKMS